MGSYLIVEPLLASKQIDVLLSQEDVIVVQDCITHFDLVSVRKHNWDAQYCISVISNLSEEEPAPSHSHANRDYRSRVRHHHSKGVQS